MAQAKWMWYPGDFEIYHSLLLHGRRDEQDWIHPAFWRLDDCWHNVRFVREYEIAEPVKVEVRFNGVGHVNFDTGYEGYSLAGTVTLPAGKHCMEIWVYRQGGLPAAYVSGGGVDSGEGWTVTNQDAHYLPVGYSDKWYTSPDDDPEIFPFAYETIKPVSIKAVNGGTFYDYGRETFARLTVRTGERPVHICYGESPEEALDVENCIIRDDAAAGGEAKLPARAFRYLWLNAPAEIEAEYEYLPLEYKGSFRCSDEKLNRIWSTCTYTFHLNSREFFLDGIKRDRWVWSGDAYQSYLVNDYIFRDEDITRRTILALRGKDPVGCHINTIQDYSFYWIMSIGERYHCRGDLEWVRSLWSSMESLMNFCLSRTDEEGLVVERPGDWVFIDWSDLDKEGGACIEQMLLVRSLETMAECANLLGKDGDCYAALAREMREKVENLYWDEEKGAYIDSFRSGKRFVTRHTNLFALRYGFDKFGRREKIIQNVLLNDAVEPITTPYFKFYEMEAWCEMGELDRVREQIIDYWGGMLDLGATTIWETYDSRKRGLEHYEMYGFQYGVSLCHAWGASPIYLLGKYFLGVAADAGGFTVKPYLGGLEWMEGTVPVQGGEVNVFCDGSVLQVSSNAKGGKLIWKGETFEIPVTGPLAISI